MKKKVLFSAHVSAVNFKRQGSVCLVEVGGVKFIQKSGL